MAWAPGQAVFKWLFVCVRDPTTRSPCRNTQVPEAGSFFTHVAIRRTSGNPWSPDAFYLTSRIETSAQPSNLTVW